MYDFGQGWKNGLDEFSNFIVSKELVYLIIIIINDLGDKKSRLLNLMY